MLMLVDLYFIWLITVINGEERGVSKYLLIIFNNGC